MVFKPQEFAERVHKLTNTGWATKQRVILLKDSTLSYYRNVPENFNKRGKWPNSCYRLASSLKDISAKREIHLKYVHQIREIDSSETKKYRILKKNEKDFFKIVFQKEGMNHKNENVSVNY